MFIFSLDTIICLLILLLVNFLIKKSSLLIDNPDFSNHKDKHEKIIPLSGGIYFVISFLFLSNLNNINIFFLVYLLPFLIIGIIADTNKNFSPKYRLILQLLFIIFFINNQNLQISSIDIDFFDYLLKFKFFNFFFVAFCIVTVLNGHNFMDGLNGFISGNLLIVLISIYIIINNNTLILDNNFKQTIEIAIIIFLVFYIINLNGICFLGDNGVYIYSIFISLVVISFVEYSKNQVSPLVAASFLWYPAYENLFSILRRLKFKKRISHPDKLHLHILLKEFLSKYLKKNISKTRLNSLSGLLINFFLIPNFVLSIIWCNDSFKLAILILFQICFYMLIYFNLIKNKK